MKVLIKLSRSGTQVRSFELSIVGFESCGGMAHSSHMPFVFVV